MAPTSRAEDTDTLTSLEERIHRAVQLVSTLRQENQAAQSKIDAALAEKEKAIQATAELQDQNTRLAEELESLKAERKQVRGRIEKLLGQMDLLSAS
jgi:uncharacterized protein (DUF3084 family)